MSDTHKHLPKCELPAEHEGPCARRIPAHTPGWRSEPPMTRCPKCGEMRCKCNCPCGCEGLGACDGDRTTPTPHDAPLPFGKEYAVRAGRYWQAFDAAQLAELNETARAYADAAVKAERERIKQYQMVALAKMLEADRTLYEQCLDTAGFAHWFNQLCTVEARDDHR